MGQVNGKNILELHTLLITILQVDKQISDDHLAKTDAF